MNIAVVVPCYKAKETVLDVLSGIGPEIAHIFVIDDACPEGTGQLVERSNADPRVRVIHHRENLGVGGATKTGYSHALEAGADIIVKLDADGQMDPALIPHLVKPIESGQADYTKGNRFYDLEKLWSMPLVRLAGNALLSFICKIANGYWPLMDPTNGFTAIHRQALLHLPFDKIADGYFFESDMLFRLNTIRAVVHDIPMIANYNGGRSGLSIPYTLLSFPHKYLRNFIKRIFYNYFLRDFNIGSLSLVFGMLFIPFGAVFGSYHLYLSLVHRIQATSGTVMLAALPILIGVHLLLTFLNQDLQMVPKTPLQAQLPNSANH